MNLHHIEQEFKTESDVLLGRIADNQTNLQSNLHQTNLNSAAIQDHFMKNFKLGNLDPFKRKKPGIGGAYRPPLPNNRLGNPASSHVRPPSSSFSQNGMEIVQSRGFAQQQQLQSYGQGLKLPTHPQSSTASNQPSVVASLLKQQEQ